MRHRFITRIRSIKPWFNPYFNNKLVMFGVYDTTYKCYVERLKLYDFDTINSYTYMCNMFNYEIEAYDAELKNYLEK